MYIVEVIITFNGEQVMTDIIFVPDARCESHAVHQVEKFLFKKFGCSSLEELQIRGLSARRLFPKDGVQYI